MTREEQRIELLIYRIKDNCYEVAKKYLKEYSEQIRAEAIEEVKTALNNKSVQITFDLPVEELLGEDVDLDDFAMLVQDAVQVYRKMVFGVLEELKEQNDD